MQKNEFELSVDITVNQVERGYSGIRVSETFKINASNFMEICEILGKFHDLAKKINPAVKL